VTKNVIEVVIANDFSKTPGPRTKEEGKYSAEEFSEKVLWPRFQEALACDGQLFVDLDGGYGYGTSFLEESFGGLARKFGVKTVQEHVVLKSDEEPYWKDAIDRYIREARGKRG
jgi:hypothetical protein